MELKQLYLKYAEGDEEKKWTKPKARSLKSKQKWYTFSQIHQGKKRIQINKIINDKGEITTDTTKIRRTIRDNYK